MASSSQKHKYWQQHIRAWQRSGLSQAAYCHAQQLSLASFGYWRKRCAAIASAEGHPAVIPVAQAPRTGGAQLRSPGGWHILLPAELDANTLCQLLTRLP